MDASFAGFQHWYKSTQNSARMGFDRTGNEIKQLENLNNEK